MVPCFNNTLTCSDDTFSVLNFYAFCEQHISCVETARLISRTRHSKGRTHQKIATTRWNDDFRAVEHTVCWKNTPVCSYFIRQQRVESARQRVVSTIFWWITRQRVVQLAVILYALRSVASFNHIWSTMRHCAFSKRGLLNLNTLHFEIFRRWKLWIYFEEKRQKLSQSFHIYTIF